MTATNDIAESLTSRRARVTPDQVGLPTYGQRRVQGLRREEVASLAGVSVEYYKRLERLTVSVYSADPGSRSQEALDLLASWTATPERSPTTVDEEDLTCRSLAAASTR